MSKGGPPERRLEIPELAELRRKTEAVSGLLRARLANHLETLRPLFAPRRLLGKHLGGSAGRDELPGADRALVELRSRYKEVAGAPFVLKPEVAAEALRAIENRIELHPWEYDHEARSEEEKRIITITSPVRWVMTYASPYSLSQLREVAAGRAEKRPKDVQQFLVNALVMKATIERFPALAELLADLRFEVGVETPDGVGQLPLVTLSSHLPSFRPPDELILTATRFSGVPEFIELVDRDAVGKLRDPLRERIAEILR